MSTVIRAFSLFLDLIFPRNPKVRELEDMSSSAFCERTKRSEVINDWFSAHSEYRDPLVRQAIWCLKYQGNRKVARLLAEIINEELMEDIAELRQFKNFIEPILIPVPLSPTRRSERGFNQTELLAEAMRRLNPDLFVLRTDIVYKIKHTPPQTLSLSRSKRIKNLKGCFEVRKPELIKGRNIILLDDVITTGSTMFEIKKALRKAGARNVIGRAVAH